MRDEQTMLLCNLHSINATRRLISIPNHGKQSASFLQCLSHSSRPFPLTRSHINLHTFSSTTMNSIPRSTTWPGLTALRHNNPFRAPLLKRSSQFYARPGRVGAPHGAPHVSRFDGADNPTLIRCSQPTREIV